MEGDTEFKPSPERQSSQEHHIIFIPGLGDKNSPLNRASTEIIKSPLGLSRRGVKVHVFRPNWNTENTFDPKLERILKEIDELTGQGHIVSIVAQSAGASAAMNAFAERPNRINGVVIVAGRLRRGENVDPTLEKAKKNSLAFEDSVLSFEKREPNLTPEQRKKVMTIRMPQDKVVPATTASLEGAANYVAKRGGHFIGGVLGSSFYSNRILDFLENLRK